MEARTFLNIGQFARICHTTKETLLHYDRKGLLKPGYIGSNGYRRYSMKQFFDFDLISLLKETGSTLEEIKVYRDSCKNKGFFPLFRERTALLLKEQERIAHRIAMLTRLTNMGEEALTADYDKIFFEERCAENILVYPVDPEKITDRESSAECYSDCMVNSLMDGNTIDPPLGGIIPLSHAQKGAFKPCFLFTTDRINTRRENALCMKEGLYACFFHNGSMQSHEKAFRNLMQSLSAMNLDFCSDVYVYDQMNYVLPETKDAFVAKYAVRVNNPD